MSTENLDEREAATPEGTIRGPVRTVTAPLDLVLRVALLPIDTGFAKPIEAAVEEGRVRWMAETDVLDSVTRWMHVSETKEGTLLRISAVSRSGLPYFRRLVGALARQSLKRGLLHMTDVICARSEGRTEPDPPHRPVWAPPDRMLPEQAKSIATICAILALTGYGGSLFTQTIHFVAESFGASDSDLGLVLAITRVGSLLALVGSILSDRRGRRRILLASTAGVLATSFLSGFAPNLGVFSVLQVMNRGFVNLSAVIAFIALTEESSEGARAYMLAVGSVAAAAGFSLGALLLPLADQGKEAWRILFAINGPALLIMRGLSRNLPETRRYTQIADRAAQASSKEMVDQTYGKRFAAVALAGFLLSFLAAPHSQFMNRYLAQERNYSALSILVLRFFTQGAPALVAVWIGGRLAETHGRKPLARWGTLAMALTTAAFFSTSGIGLWVWLLVSTIAGAVAGPSLSTFNTELFPTEVRGRAGGWLLITAVCGSAAGLLTTGYLSGPLGSVGRAIALTTIGPILVSIFLIQRLPEGRGVALDELSPPEV